MAIIEPIYGIRYNLGQIGSLQNVVAPPYDVIDGAYQDDLYKRHPANVVRLILNRTEPEDKIDANYHRAARFLDNWLKGSILVKDAHPSLYVYHQEFTALGETFTRRGFMAGVGLEPLGEGTIYPHEQTHAAAKEDRLKLFHATKANLSPIFGIYPDPENQVQFLLDREVGDKIPYEVTDDLGCIHRVWAIDNQQVIGQVQSAMYQKSLYIADGHHRYETSLNYLQELLAENPDLPQTHPAQNTLMMCVSMNDPGMIVLPTHRLFRGFPTTNAQQAKEKLSSCFEIAEIGIGASQTNLAWETIETGGNQSALALYFEADQTWLELNINQQGRHVLKEQHPDQSEAWRNLGVTILHELVVKHLFGQTDLLKPLYVHSPQEVEEKIVSGDSPGRDLTGQAGTENRLLWRLCSICFLGGCGNNQ